MRAYMTSGTLDFLEKIAAKQSHLSFFYMTRASSTLAYYEDSENSKSVFAAGRAFDIMISKGEVLEEGYVVMNHIPITEEGKPVFENRLKQREEPIGLLKGLQAFRLLKPMKGNIYIIFSQWTSKDDYDDWKQTEDYKTSLENHAVKPPAYFASRPFINTYQMYIEDEDSADH